MGWSSPQPFLRCQTHIQNSFELPKKIETLYTLKKNEQTVGLWGRESLVHKSARFYISRFPNLPHVLTRNKHRKLLSTPACKLELYRVQIATLFKMLTICCDSSRVSSCHTLFSSLGSLWGIRTWRPSLQHHAKPRDVAQSGELASS
jgi:hypothetical protein